MKDFEQSKCDARNAIAADLLAGKKVSSVRYNPSTGNMEQTYGTTDFRKRISELRLEYGMNIQYVWEPNIGNRGQHKIHYMTPEDIQAYKDKKAI